MLTYHKCTELSDWHLSVLLQLFFGTYAFYHDRHSRRAVQLCIRTIFLNGGNLEVLDTFVKTLQDEAAKPGIAPGNAFVLMEWFSILLLESAGTDYWAKWGLDLIYSHAQVLELCESSPRPSLRHSALVVTRRALRKVFLRQDNGQESINGAVTRLTAKGSQPLWRNTLMLGVIAGVCARDKDAKATFQGMTPDIYAFYIREILGSRTSLPPHIANGLYDFFSSYATTEDVEKQLIPAVEKSLLRAPEIVLDDLITPLFKSFSVEIDLSDSLRNKLLKPLLSNTKSSNVAVRQGAIAAFKAAISHCQLKELLGQISDEILSPIKSGKVPAADQRALYSEMLAVVPISDKQTEKILTSVAAVAAKETNEVALSAETVILRKYALWCLEKDIPIDKVVADTMTKGFSDKKVSIRRIWAIRFGEMLWAINSTNLEKPSLIKIVEAVLPGLLDIWSEVVANPIVAAQSGLVTIAFILTAISSTKLELMNHGKVDTALKKAHINKQALTAFEPKRSYLLSHRVYTKLTNDDDLLWLIRALAAVSSGLDFIDATSPVAIAWSQAMIFCICSTVSTPPVRRQGIEALSRVYIQKPTRIANFIISGLLDWIQSVEVGDKDGAAAAGKVETANLHLVVKSICLPRVEAARLGGEVDALSREQQMVSMLVISRPELLPQVNWIDLCLRVEVDPGDLARKYSDDLLRVVRAMTDFNENVSSISVLGRQSHC
jgi:Generalcontrol nonderepressible 1 (Gcn1) N-terminal